MAAPPPIYPRRDNPSVMDYIRLKAEVVDLEKQASEWRRKIELLLMERQRTRAMLKSVAGMTGGGGMSVATSVAIGSSPRSPSRPRI